MGSEDHDTKSFRDKIGSILEPQPPKLIRSTSNGIFDMSPEMFAKLYLTPQNRVKGHLRDTFGNPSPLTLLGLCMSLTPISCDLMGWGGSGGSGAASIGTYFFTGGLLMVIAGIFEFILGNTFPFVVSCGFGLSSTQQASFVSVKRLTIWYFSLGGFWFTMGATLSPGFGAYAHYSSDQTQPLLGLSSPGFLASFAFYYMCMGIFCVICTVCSFRTNVANFIIFLFLTIQYILLASSYWTQANDMIIQSNRIAVAAGASGFVVITAGWYLFAAQMLASIDFPYALPVGDLSNLVRGAHQKQITEGEDDMNSV
ncbi:hypothetical protein BP6252_11908 [Coleophoma cylindrospora]|uniref:GPR1 protein n=1 Tax=Coleophoma cylindrospora TaxID=1849047 RepID=A0A3D8QKY8_9HELO|nr:hypothetical protein BP6252_11908 [Coleophoma cylindrospora]